MQICQVAAFVSWNKAVSSDKEDLEKELMCFTGVSRPFLLQLDRVRLDASPLFPVFALSEVNQILIV